MADTTAVMAATRASDRPASSRRFPPPRSVGEENAACFIVKDLDGISLAYVYFEDEPGRRAAAKLLTPDGRIKKLSTTNHRTIQL